MNDQGVDLIPRKTLFGNPERTAVTLSHDGTRVAYLAPVDGVLNVWVAPVEAIGDAKPVTRDRGRGIRHYLWSYHPGYFLYGQDRDGDEDWHVHAVEIDTGRTRDLTPYDGVQAIPHGLSDRFPDEVLIAVNRRDPQYHDLYRVHILTGESGLVVENDVGASQILADHDFNPRLAVVIPPVGGAQILSRSGPGAWEPFMTIGPEDDVTTGPLHFDATGRFLYLRDSRGRDTAALVALDTETGAVETLASDARADASHAINHPATHRPQAVAFEYQRVTWTVLDESVAADFERLADGDRGEFRPISRSLDDRTWIVAYDRADGPQAYYRYDRESGSLEYLFSNRPELERTVLAPMQSAVVRSRDQFDIVAYYSLPVGSTTGGADRPSEPLPAVLYVHGGPWSRDSWGYDPVHQLMTNRGYATISVNYRGSWGFGKAFVNAANGEWAGRMHDDLIDVVEWAVEQGIADPDRIAIMGGSYGGYATLVGLTFTPEVFACGVDLVGPSNLNTVLESVPPYWKPMLGMLRTRVGDNSTPEGRRFLAERSPLSRVDQIVRPLLIGQGANDPRVKQAESDQIVAAMTERGIPVTYLLYTDEGHGFARPENNLSFMAVAEAFLARCLGGRHEPVGDDFEGSSIQVVAGAEEVPGLQRDR